MNRAVIKPVIAIAARLVFLWNGNVPSVCHRKSPNQDTCRSAAIPSVCYPSTPRPHAALLQRVICWHAKPICRRSNACMKSLLIMLQA